MLADCLAIPQLNDGGDKVDWYAPQAGKAIPWASAEEKLRLQALRYLDNCLQTASQLSERSLRSPKYAEQRFGSLLQHAFRFPDDRHVYLVDEKPVLTFWGFIELNTTAGEAPLACLYDSLKPELLPFPEEAPPVVESLPVNDVVIEDPEPLIVTLSKSAAAPAPSLPPSAAPQEPLPAPRQNVWLKIMWPVLSIALFIALLLAWPWLYPLVHPQAVEPPTVKMPEAEPRAAAKAVTRQVFNSPLPLQHATLTPQAVEEPKPAAPPPKNALVLPAKAVKAGTTKFLDGHWRVSFSASDEMTDMPVGMRIRISDNVGQVRLVYGDSLVCRAGMHSGLMQSGNLVIKPLLKVKAKCADGSRYAVPEIICSQGLTGAAQCNARFENDVTVPVTVTRVGA